MVSYLLTKQNLFNGDKDNFGVVEQHKLNKRSNPLSKVLSMCTFPETMSSVFNLFRLNAWLAPVDMVIGKERSTKFCFKDRTGSLRFLNETTMAGRECFSEAIVGV